MLFVVSVLSCKFCCFESAFSPMSCVDLYVFFFWRAPDGLDSKGLPGRRTYVRLTHAVFTKKLWPLSATHENSSHLSTAAVPFSKVTAASSLLIGKGSFHLSFVVVRVIQLSQLPLSSLAFCGCDDLRYF